MNAAVRIAQLRLQTSELGALHRFYEQTLGLTVSRDADAIRVEAGATEIIFDSLAASDTPPFYHFAWNIPQNKLELVRLWQRERTPLIRRDGEEVIEFPAWNAQSVFFHDPVGNILEHIARHDLDNSAVGEFEPSRDVLCVSEIGVVVDDVPKAVAMIRESLGIEIYRDNYEAFASMGDANGLLILVQRDRKWTPDRVREAQSFPMHVKLRGARPGLLRIGECEIEVSD